MEKIRKSDTEWRQVLSPEQFHVLREKGTEPPGTGALYRNHESGVYTCAACGYELFRSDTKYDSGSGWPSFFAPIENERVETHEDLSHGMRRIEVTCARCGSHLGHVFPDGPRPTGLRYCVNSASLGFKK
jgi:peptide-methionine (R)-S-oxide reductase